MIRGQARTGADPARRAAPAAGDARRRGADLRRDARADDRSVPAAHRRARAARGRARAPGAGRHGHHHGSAHRRDPRAGQLSDVQPERVRQVDARGPAQSRGAGRLRAGLDVQDRHGVGGARGRRRLADRPDRQQPGLHHVRGRKPITTTSTSYGVLSFEDVIVKSSNVGAIKIGLRVGANGSAGTCTGSGSASAGAATSPARARGIVCKPAELDDSGLASMSMGYQISVTPLQMATAASVVANGGLLIEPHVVRRRHPRRRARRPVAPKIAATGRSRRRPPRR